MIAELIILGNSSATPTLRRFPSAQYFSMHGHHMLIDCGEGTQMQMQRYRIKKSKIKHVFISHIHADHMLGLPGLLFSMNLMQRTEPIHIYGPPTLFEILDLFIKNTESELHFEIIPHHTNPNLKELIFEDEFLKVFSFPLFHRIPTTGFLFQEHNKPLKINAEACKLHGVTVADYPAIKKGLDYTNASGQVIPNALLTKPAEKQVSYAYCSDTMYHNDVINEVRGVDLLYHEATFLHDKLERANQTKHSTALQAGMVAKQAGVERLIIGHFSSRYDVLDELLAETKQMFENSFIANEGERFVLS